MIDNVPYYYSGVGPLQYMVLVLEVDGLFLGEHTVTIMRKTEDTKSLVFDAVDIDSTGTLKPYNPNPTPAISAPTNLIATAGDSQVTLSWTAITGATGYNVKRATTTGGPYTTVAIYVVTAVNADGESANSNEASATPVVSSKALLRVTMSDSSEREYKLTTTEINDFVKWINQSTNTGNHCYTFNDTIEGSTEYLLFEKITSFKVVPLAK